MFITVQAKTKILLQLLVTQLLVESNKLTTRLGQAHKW